MDLKSLGKIVAPLAPSLGSIIGGFIPFPGGAFIGQKVGEMVARAFGVNPASPTAASEVNEAIAVAGEETARDRIKAVTEQARIQVEGFVAYERAILEAQVKNLSDVNLTIRDETEARVKLRLAGLKDHWFYSGWRPAFGWVFLSVYGVFGLMLTLVTGRSVWMSTDPFNMLKDAWPLFASYFWPGAAMLGVMIPSRSAEKIAAVNSTLPKVEPTTVLPKQPVVVPMPKVAPNPGKPLPITPQRPSGGGGVG